MHLSNNPERKVSTNWRVIITDPAQGAWNMALDEAILRTMVDAKSFPTIRFYSWQPACLSIGYSQTFSDVNEHWLAKTGWDVVRRITGGKAILHTDELTYSIIGRTNEPLFERGILSSYRRIASALLHSLHTLGIDASMNNDQISASAHQNAGPVCFEMPSNYEITVDGKKILGSAQARKKTGIIQHGTLPLYGDLSRILDCLVTGNNIPKNVQIQKLHKRTTTVEKALGRKLSFDQIVENLQRSFQTELGIKLIESTLTQNELDLTDRLVKEKYASDSWTKRIPTYN